MVLVSHWSFNHLNVHDLLPTNYHLNIPLTSSLIFIFVNHHVFKFIMSNYISWVYNCVAGGRLASLITRQHVPCNWQWTVLSCWDPLVERNQPTDPHSLAACSPIFSSPSSSASSWSCVMWWQKIIFATFEFQTIKPQKWFVLFEERHVEFSSIIFNEDHLHANKKILLETNF